MTTLQAARRLARLASYTLLALVVALSLARYLDAPLALVLVAGRSMEPSIHLGDLALLERVDDPHSLKPGDVVLWCLGKGCVLHRVQGFQDGRIITKGDANPYPDPPVPLEAVKYRMLLRIPREAYLAPLAAYLALEALEAARSGRLRRLIEETAALQPGRLETLALAALLVYAVSILAASIAAPPPAQRSDLLEGLRPRINLLYTGLVKGGNVEAIFSLENVPAFNPTGTCTMAIAGVEVACSATLLYNNGTLAAILVSPTDPERLYTKAYILNSNTLIAKLDVDIEIGVLHSRLLLRIPIKQVTVKLDRDNCSLVIVNPNEAPIKVPVNITVRYFDYRGGRIKHLALNKTETLTVEANPGVTRISLEKHDWLIVRVSYIKPGGIVVEREVANTWCRTPPGTLQGRG